MYRWITNGPEDAAIMSSPSSPLTSFLKLSGEYQLRHFDEPFRYRRQMPKTSFESSLNHPPRRVLSMNLRVAIRDNYVNRMLGDLYKIRDAMLSDHEDMLLNNVWDELVVDLILEYLADDLEVLDEWIRYDEIGGNNS